jgi:hypothetical protein
MSNPVSGYEGFESPDEQYYGTNPTLPVLFTGTYQVRQFGAGGASTYGRPKSITSALANPTAHMTTAENDSIAHATSQYVVTDNDKFNYWSASSSGLS